MNWLAKQNGDAGAVTLCSREKGLPVPYLASMRGASEQNHFKHRDDAPRMSRNTGPSIQNRVITPIDTTSVSASPVVPVPPIAKALPMSW